MNHESLEGSPGPRDRTIRTSKGQVLEVPAGWTLLPPGDAGLTRKVKASGPTWTVKEKKGRRTFSRGVWACGKQIAAAKRSVEAKRSDPTYQKQLDASRARRAKQQVAYVQEFQQTVLDFLNFDPIHIEIADAIALAVAQHATPVGSGTVARTERIPITKRAESAVIAWMRHQTTAYDNMQIARRKGERRQVRRQLAGQSRKVLDAYRRGILPSDRCPLAKWYERHCEDEAAH